MRNPLPGELAAAESAGLEAAGLYSAYKKLDQSQICKVPSQQQSGL